MFNKIFTYSNFISLVTISFLGFFVYLIYQVSSHPPELREFKGGIQNHLVWSIKNECYFVRPATGHTVYLVRIEDCDKK